MSGPRGPKPKRAFSSTNIIIYGTLFVVCIYYLLPHYVMIVTSLKGMPEIRLGNIFSPPVEVTFEPWIKAWAHACTGINCEGLSRGFSNSVWILVPSVLLSIAIASGNGYALANWKFKGSEVFFTILIFCAFIPYQVMIYPIVIILRESGEYITTISECPKMMLGPCAGGSVRLSEGRAPLIVCGGIETGLSLVQMLFKRSPEVWASLSTGGMRSLILPKLPRDLIIATDGEEVGRFAGQRLASKATKLGWSIEHKPAPNGQGWTGTMCSFSVED